MAEAEAVEVEMGDVQPEEDSLDALQARVVESGGPPAAPRAIAREWLRFIDAPTPGWAPGPSGKLSLNAPASATRINAFG